MRKSLTAGLRDVPRPAHRRGPYRPTAALALCAAVLVAVASAGTPPSEASTAATLPVKVFNYPGLNNPVGNLNCSNENQNLIEIIEALPGYSVDGQLQSFGGTAWLDGTKPAEFTVEFFAAQLDDAVFFVMTDIEEFTSGANPADEAFYPAAARTVLREWVEAGGILVMTGTAGENDTLFLNLTFDWDLTTETASEWAKNTANTAGTPFEAVDAPTLPRPSATDAIGSGTVPGFTPMWGDATNATVAVIDRGAGKVIFLGFDFFNTGLDSSEAGDGSGSVCAQNNNVWVQEVLPAALDYARGLSLDRIPEELRRELGLGDPPGVSTTTTPGPSPVEQAVAVAVEQAAGLTGTSGLLIRDGAVVPLLPTITPAAGPRGGLVLEDEDETVKVTFTTTAGVSPTAGVVVPVDGEIVCEICLALSEGSVVEAWILSEPRLAAAVLVEVDGEDEDGCPLLRIPVGAPLDGAGAIEPGAHTLQLRMYTDNGFEVLAVPITVGGPVPTSVPSGEGPGVPVGLVLLLAGLGGLAAVTAGRSMRTAGQATATV